MKRFDIINYLIKINNYKNFLEIGTQEHINLSNVIIDKKVSVDPDPEVNADFIISSDSFFEINKDKFDIIFVDGLHHSDFSYRDIINSLRILNPGGCVVVHDVIPSSYEGQLIPLEKTLKTGTGIWNGDVWKSIVILRFTKPNLEINVVDTDWGVGIVRFGKQKVYDKAPLEQCLDYHYFDNNREELLNILSVEEFYNKFKK